MVKKVTKPNLEAYTDEQLKEELTKRTRPEPPYPRAATNVAFVDLVRMRDLVMGNVERLREEGREIKDVEQYCYEIAMEMFYGKEIWAFVKAILK